MRTGWQTKSLEEICEIERGGSPRPIKKFLTTATNGINWIKIGDATASDKYIYKTEQKITVDGMKRSRMVYDGDFLLSNSMSFGRPYIMKTTGCIHDGWLVLRQREKQLEQDFLFYLLSSDEVFHQFDRLAAGSTVRNLNIGLVKSVKISFPTSLTEQRRIIGILDKAFQGIATAKANTEKNLQNAQDFFGGYLHSIIAQRGNGWVERKLGDESLLEIIDGDRGINYPKASDFHDEGHCLFLNTKNVRPNGFDFENTMFITAEKDGRLRKGKLQRDDVVMTTRGTIGNLGLYSEEVPFDNIRINSGMLIFRSNKRALLPSFLFQLLRSVIVKDQIKKHTTGAAQPQLPIKTLVNFSLPVLTDLDEQIALVKKIQAFEIETQRLESLYEQKLAELEALKKSLLHQAFVGGL